MNQSGWKEGKPVSEAFGKFRRFTSGNMPWTVSVGIPVPGKILSQGGVLLEVGISVMSIRLWGTELRKNVQAALQFVAGKCYWVVARRVICGPTIRRLGEK